MARSSTRCFDSSERSPARRRGTGSSHLLRLMRSRAQRCRKRSIRHRSPAMQPGRERVTIPLVQRLIERVSAIDPAAATYVHWGATSQDVTDTALVLCLARAHAHPGRRSRTADEGAAPAVRAVRQRSDARPYVDAARSPDNVWLEGGRLVRCRLAQRRTDDVRVQGCMRAAVWRSLRHARGTWFSTDRRVSDELAGSSACRTRRPPGTHTVIASQRWSLPAVSTPARWARLRATLRS